MPRLSSLDAAFLGAETDTAHMHVGWASVFSPPEGGSAPTFPELRDFIASRLHRAPRYRQRLESLPLDLAAPVWVDDTDFRIEHHVVRSRATDLPTAFAECMSTPLAQDRPLWQFSIVESLDENGRIGLVGKAHHCMVDGIAAVELASLLLDPTPDPPPPEPDRWHPTPAPGRARLLAEALARRSVERVRIGIDLARTLTSPDRLRQAPARVRGVAAALVDAVRPASLVEPLNQPISPRRGLGTLRRPLDDLRRIKQAFGATVNDVLLAASAGALRDHLRVRGIAPVPLKTMVPVNLREPDEDDPLGNRISFLFVDIPCDEPDAVRRLRTVHAETATRKRAGVPAGADALLEAAGQVPYPAQGAVSQAVASPRAFNLAISNIPGPPAGMHMLGCRLEEAYPVVPIPDEHSLSIGMTTVGDRAYFGLYVDPATFPEVDALAAGIEHELDVLLEQCSGAGEVADPAVPSAAG